MLDIKWDERWHTSTTWSYGVVAITLDFESNNPSSNLGRTCLFVAINNSVAFIKKFVFIADFNQDLSKSISALKDAVALVRETGEEPELWSNKDVQSLLLYLQSSE